MLKVFNPFRLYRITRHISTSSARWQGNELVKSKDRDDRVRAVEKKPQRLPLVKNFFAQRMDTDLMAFPEAIFQTEHLNSVNRWKQEYEEFLDENIFKNPDDVNNIRKLKEFGAFRMNTQLVTESLYGFSELEAKYLSYSTFLNNHQQIAKIVSNFGDASQKLKYLPKLDEGELIAVPCVFEPKAFGSGKKTFATEVKYKDDPEQWILNGEKAFVLMSPAFKDSTLFAVVASIDTVDHIGDFKEGLTMLFVEGNLPGVSISKVDQTIGFGEKLFNQVTVSFKDVVLDKSNVLTADGFKVTMSLLNSLRLHKGVQALNSVMKPMLKHLSEHCINTSIQGINLKDVDTVKEKLGSLTSKCYALESLIYMTAGLIDIYENQDVEVECAIVHAFAMQSMSDFIMRPLQSIGPLAVVKGAGYDRFVRDAIQLSAYGESLDSVKQFIAIAGLNHSGQLLYEDIMKNRNPLNHPNFIFSRIFNNTSIERPKKKFNLENFAHPTLAPAASFLESSVIRLYAAVDILFARHGSLVVQHSVETGKISEAALLCYAMFATVARSSRSYCIGLRNAEQELHLTNFFCYEASERVKHLAKEIDNGEYGTSEHTYKIVGEKLIENKQYHIEHPTTRNY